MTIDAINKWKIRARKLRIVVASNCIYEPILSVSHYKRINESISKRLSFFWQMISVSHQKDISCSVGPLWAVAAAGCIWRRVGRAALQPQRGHTPPSVTPCGGSPKLYQLDFLCRERKQTFFLTLFILFYSTKAYRAQTHSHWMLFFDFLEMRWIPSRTLVMSYIRLFWTSRTCDAQFRSTTPSADWESRFRKRLVVRFKEVS